MKKQLTPKEWAKDFESLLARDELKRIADAIEEILRLVKKDMEPRTKKEKE